jgi:hypothetical protein
MPRYYFHWENGHILHDGNGLELPDLAAAQHEALETSIDLIKGRVALTTLWNGTPWRMWVTDKPNGDGKTLFTLRLSADM